MRKHLLAVGLLVLVASALLYGQDYGFTVIRAAGQIISTVTTGTAPFVVSSTTLVANLHAAVADTATTVTSVLFSSITSATNTVGAFICGTGCSITTSGSGTNNATTLEGATFEAPNPIGTIVSSTGAFTTLSTTTSNSIGGGYLSETRIVSAGLTTTASLLVSTQSTGNVGTSALGATDVAGVAITSQTAGIGVQVAVKGQVLCIADNTVTANDVIGVGTTTAGRCKDLGATSGVTISSLLLIVGKALTSAAAGSPFALQVYSQGLYGQGNPSSGQVTSTIASGTLALATGAISSGTCTAAQTATATGTATTDNIMADFNADPTAVTGYSPSVNGMLTIIKYPTTNTANFKICNLTSASITPGAITLNFRVTR